MADLMGELRGALHEPCVESWQRIIALLDECKDRDQLVQEAIPYAHGLISRWPQDVPRDIPRAWAKGFHNEGPVSPELYDLITGGKHGEALELWRRMAPANIFFWTHGYNVGVKQATNYMGRAVGPCRKPTLPLSDAEWAELKAALDLLR